MLVQTLTVLRPSVILRKFIITLVFLQQVAQNGRQNISVICWNLQIQEMMGSLMMKPLTTPVEIFSIYIILLLTPRLDEGLPPLTLVDEQPEDPLHLDSWSPPAPSSMPINSGYSQPLPPIGQQPPVGDTPVVSLAGLHKEHHPSPSLFIPGGKNLLQRIDESDQFASLRAGETDMHYLFASQSEWRLAKWLVSAPLS